ncbi:hypothetical protein [Cellulomonas sp. PhB143]|uniref:hypothetical protein n=1 Tax=Cellulomonas sp. PhB143 TaxID=2485186 RepID=UPI000F9BD9B9|nr:hypothetical protein [Cellulomonas sp. PhB143]ROS78677.1 O-antigen/teichoic acid export membrane protein [Cellulomonas sp. PhB143]
MTAELDPAVPSGRRRGRLVLSLADQGASSLSNVLAVLLVARTLPSTEFGYFSVNYSLAVLLLGVCRSYLGTRLTMTHDVERARRLAKEVLGSVIVLALPLAVVSGLGGLLLSGGRVPTISVVVAVALPMMCAQDLVRFAGVAVGRPQVALSSDITWLVVLAAGFVLPLESTTEVLVLWVGAIVAALLVGAACLRIRPSMRDGASGMKARDAVAGSMAVGTLVSLGSSVVVASASLAIAGPQVAAALRGASTLMGPLNSLSAFVNIAMTPTVLREPRGNDRRTGAKVAVALVIASVLVGAVLLVLPGAWGEELLGETWDLTRGVIPFTTVQYVFLAVGTAASLILRVRRAAGPLLTQKIVAAVLSVGLGCAGAATLGTGAAVAGGLAAASFVGALIGVVQVRRATSRPGGAQ